METENNSTLERCLEEKELYKKMLDWNDWNLGTEHDANKHIDGYWKILQKIADLELQQHIEAVTERVREGKWKHKVTRNMSTLSLESVLPHLDANKRILLSICYPSFRKLEKKVPISFDSLKISSSSITINEKSYQFGEIQFSEETQIFNCDSIKKIRANLKRQNLEGGLPWRSLRNDVLEPGDLLLGIEINPLDLLQQFKNPVENSRQFLEHQKLEKMIEIRHGLLKLIERNMFIDPILSFELTVPMERKLWDTHFSSMFLMLGMLGMSPALRSCNDVNITKIYEEHPLINYETADREDELSRLYPEATRKLKAKFEEMVQRGDMRLWALKKLVSPPKVLSHFNQFTVFNFTDLVDYLKRLPSGLSLRTAFKQFSSLIFGGRGKIQVDVFELCGTGIIPLPVGLEIECDVIEKNNDCDFTVLMKAYDKVVRTLNQLICRRLSGEEDILMLPMVQKCKQLEMYSFSESKLISRLRLLNNDSLMLGLNHSPKDNYSTIIEELTKNSDINIGSKFYIAFERCSYYSHNANLTKLLEMGFKRNKVNDSVYLPLEGNKCLELSIESDKTIFSNGFRKRTKFEFYLQIEVVRLE